MRKESIFSTKNPPPPGAASGQLVPSTVKREIDKVKRELVGLSPTAKMLIAVRKVLVQLSNTNTDGSRFYISGDRVRVTEAPQPQVVKEGEFVSYSASGYARLGVSLKSGEMAYRFIQFTISFRDCLDNNGLPDVEFFDPTELTEVDRHHPEVAEL